MNKTKQKTGCAERKYENGKTTGCPTVVARETFGHDRCGGFTLVELVIVIAIVIILSVISVPIYRGYVDKAKMAEGYALLGSIVSAQKAYYCEYGNFLLSKHTGKLTSNEVALGIDARGNKYFTLFFVNSLWSTGSKDYFACGVMKPEELRKTNGSGKIFTYLALQYNNNATASVVRYLEDWV